MLLSLLVYSLTGATLFFLGWHVNKREQRLKLDGGTELPFYSWEIMLSLLIFSVIAGARYHTGFDHAMYLDQYLHLQETGDFSRHNFEYGFEWISRLFAFCGLHYFFYFAFWALLQIGFLYYGLRHHKHLLCWVGLGIMFSSYFLWWMNSVRQSVVVCLFVALVPLIKERKIIPYVIIVIIATLFHKSALLLLPVFLISFLKDDFKMPNRWILLSVYIIFVLLGTFLPLLFNYNDFITNTHNQWLLDITGYGNYSNLNDPNVGNRWKGIIPWGPSRISMFLGCVSIIFLYPELKSHFKNDKYLSLYFILAFLGFCLYYFLINTTHFLLRPIDYFSVFYLVMGAYMMVYLIGTKRFFFAIVIGLLLYTHFIINVYKAVYIPNPNNQPFLYHFFFAPSL